jgi:DNA (cytosine-5)-methyltransferase 1
MSDTEHPTSTRDVSEIMRRVHSTNTAPETRFQDELRARGLEFEANVATLPGKPDIVVASARVVVFIDGDFWHGGQWLRRKKRALDEQFSATATKDYWLKKIRRNMQRDCVATVRLIDEGWTVLRFWETDIRKRLGDCVTLTLATCDNGRATDSTTLLPRKTVAEFFAGIGLMRMGLEVEGWRVVYANDLDPQKREMYAAHFPDANEHFDPSDVHDVLVSTVPTVTLATASFPCNDLSLAGARVGLNGKESSAFWGFIRLIREMGRRRPPLVLLENVTGLLTSHKGADMRQAVATLNELGYAADAFILDAANFVPQSRQRLFIVGVQEDLLPSTTLGVSALHSESDSRPRALMEFIEQHRDLHWTARPLPVQPVREKSLADILDDLPDDSPKWWSAERATYLLNQMSAAHRAKADALIAGDGWSYGTVFRRMRNDKSMAELRTDGIAGCLRTPRGGSGRQILFKAGKGRYMARLMTPRECARLMGADDFRIEAPVNQALFGFGDAVCVPAVSWIATYYLNPLIAEAMRGVPLAAPELEAVV